MVHAIAASSIVMSVFAMATAAEAATVTGSSAALASQSVQKPLTLAQWQAKCDQINQVYAESVVAAQAAYKQATKGKVSASVVSAANATLNNAVSAATKIRDTALQSLGPRPAH